MSRAGKVVGLNEARSCTVSEYKYIGDPWSARLLYRTRNYLEVGDERGDEIINKGNE